MLRLGVIRELVCFALLALGFFPSAGRAAPPVDEILRYSNNEPGNSRPIIVHADQTFSWKEGARRILLFKGHVLVDHGTITMRMDQGVAVIDTEQRHRTNILHVDFYAEGNVKLEAGPVVQTHKVAVIDLNTRGEFRVRNHVGKLVEGAQADDPIYRRAMNIWNARTAVPGRAFERTMGYQEPGGQGPAPPNEAGPAPPLPGPPAGSALPPPNPNPQTPAQNEPAPAVSTPPSSAPPGVPDLRPSQIAIPGPPPGVAPAGPRQAAPVRQFSLVPRTATGFGTSTHTLPNGEHVLVITGGIILVVKMQDQSGLLDIEADTAVIWTKDDPRKLLTKLSSGEGENSRQFEIYLEGNVEIRQQSATMSRKLLACKVYYDVARNVAIALDAQVEFKDRRLGPDAVNMRAQEVQQLSPELFKGFKAEIFASRLPSDPGLKVYVSEATFVQSPEPRRNFLGLPFFDLRTMATTTQGQQLYTGSNMLLKVEDVPIFYWPYVHGDVNDPVGPLEGLSYSFNKIFGSQFGASFNLADVFAIIPPDGLHWHGDVEYLSYRGPALGTTIEFEGKSLFGMPTMAKEYVRIWGIGDKGTDILGGDRGPLDHHPYWRGRVSWTQSLLGLPDGFTFQSQLGAYTDKNFYEQYFKNEFDNDPNQWTFMYLKQQQNNWSWDLWGQAHIRNWVTETNWLPKAEGRLYGQSFFNLFTYNVEGQAGYAQLFPTSLPPPPFSLTTRRDDTGRFDLWQELNLPFTLGPFRLVPYAVLDLTEYTSDLDGNTIGRVLGGGGMRGSIPFSRLYPDIQSDLFNVKGIYHKVVFGGNFYAVKSNTPYFDLPQLDRLNDDASDQSVRDMKVRDPFLLPGVGAKLATSPLYDPQTYAIRTLIDNAVDSRDTIEVFQMDLRQRWQTKRGYPGMEHTIDWMTLDLSASWFPEPSQNFGSSFAFLQYDWIWNIGDRTALTSSAWVDPIDDGARVFNFGGYFNRTDRTNFFLGYTQVDPLLSKAVTGAVTYVFSPKYSTTAQLTYDFGIQSQVASVLLTRTGTDLQASMGLSYNSYVNTFSFTFMLIPNIAAIQQRYPGQSSLTPNGIPR